MLQWMGGSRRKVNDSRRSKQKRQKQYFEQRKRQQHEHITSSADNFVDGHNTCSQNQKEKRSLDVLSLHSLSEAAEQLSSACDGILKDHPLPDKCLKTRNLPKFSNKIVTRANNVETSQRRNNSNSTEQRMPEEEFRIDTSKLYNSTSKEGNPKGEEQKHASGQKFEDLSVFELIDEDGKSSNKSEEKTEYEGHVAFSMQGLGKVGSETPVKSPQPSKRIKSDGQSGFFKAAKYEYSRRNFDNLLEDHEMVKESRIEDGDMFLNGKYSSSDYGQSWRFGSSDHQQSHFLKDNSKLRDKRPQMKCFDDIESIDDIQETHANFLEVKESRTEDGDMFLNGKYSSPDYGQSWRFGSYDHQKLNFLTDNSKLYNKRPQVKCFGDIESIDDIQEIHANFLEAPSDFPVSCTFNEKFGIDEQNACFTDVYSIRRTHEEDFTEEFRIAKRSYSDQYGLYGQTDRFCDLDFPSRYPKHQLEEDYDFLKPDDSDYFIANKFTNVGAKQSRFSYLKADNPLDNISSLSGESCSSSAVKGNSTIGRPPARKSRKISSEFIGVTPKHETIKEDLYGELGKSTCIPGQKSRKISSEFIGATPKHKTIKEDFYGELGKSTCMPGQHGEYERPRGYLKRPVHADFSDLAFGESFDQVDDCTGKAGFNSTGIHLAQHTNKDHSTNCEPVGEDIFALPTASSFHFDSHLSFGGCKDDSSVESATPMDLSSKKSAFGHGFSSLPEKGCGKSREVSGKRESKDFLTEQCSGHRNAHDNSSNGSARNGEEICAGPEGNLSLTPKPLQETHEKLSKKNADDSSSSFVRLSDNSGTRASEKECRNSNLDLQTQELVDLGTCESEQKSVSSDGENSSIEPSYQVMMLESHMLRLLCVKKKRKSAKEEILKRA